MQNTAPEANTEAPVKSVIQLNNVHKWYGEFHVLKDINLNVDP